MHDFKPIAKAESVTVYCPLDGKYAFYNSPYPAHRLSTGLDIYSSNGFGEVAPSPVNGEVIEVRRVKAPKSRFFHDPGYDVVTVVDVEGDPDTVVKLLHVEPQLRPGDRLEVGDDLGVLLHSGYYGFSTSPHIHLEVRRSSDPLRVRGGIHLNRVLEAKPEKMLDRLRGRVVHSDGLRSFIELCDLVGHGVPGDVGGVPGYLDGGIPFYGWLGAHYEERPGGDTIKLAGEIIADIVYKGERYCVADCTDFKITMGDTTVGFFAYLHPGHGPQIMLTGRRPGEISLKDGECVELEIKPD
ncbi:MAG: hypothetical protein ACLFVP_06765 [Candidatus Bathyarchaeia archaeon]